jgi:hypothetical protein
MHRSNYNHPDFPNAMAALSNRDAQLHLQFTVDAQANARATVHSANFVCKKVRDSRPFHPSVPPPFKSPRLRLSVNHLLARTHPVSVTGGMARAGPAREAEPGRGLVPGRARPAGPCGNMNSTRPPYGRCDDW